MTKVDKMRLSRPESLPGAALRLTCDPDSLGFKTTADLPDFVGLLGQERAIKAIDLAAGIKHPSFNLYALGGVLFSLSYDILQAHAHGVQRRYMIVLNQDAITQVKAVVLPTT